ncbi:DUF47 domain-containing protein [Fervidobacterium thailandense]|uniref:PhoU family transcriptional regulator n=1 Tax=Fervidobacterium thailandense TaxID=1008305 RepID=A0A1E3G5G3_9BACT|nr:DUF47 family protein [Fervidobacterium thailandense]ODN31093.1 PhoU family transcriptional regulator [Fervidobacterium thailandense]
MANIFQKLIPYKSPIQLLVEHAQLCVRAGELMEQAVKDYFTSREISGISKLIDELEDEADAIKLKLREIYSKLKWTYFNKNDFLDLLHNIDSIIDLTDDVLKMLTMNSVEDTPEDVKKDVVKLAELVRLSIKHMYDSVEELKTLIESAFSPREVRKEDEQAQVVEREEHSSDLLGIDIGKRLFSLKNRMNAVDIMFLNSVVILLMRIEDRAKNVVEKVRLISHS